VQEALMAAVSGGVVGGSVLPAAPDDLGPAAGEDAFGVGVGLAGGSELAVAVFCPGVASPAVAGEVAEGVAEFLVAAEAEGDRAPGVTLVALESDGGGGEAGAEHGGALAAAVAVGPQPGAEALLRQPGGPGGGGEPFEEPQRDGAVEVTEQADGAGEHDAQV